MYKITYRAAAVAVLALCAGTFTLTCVVRADEPAPDAAAKAGDAAAKDWSEHVGDIPFVMGRAAGEAEAEFSGKPPMYYFTATW